MRRLFSVVVVVAAAMIFASCSSKTDASLKLEKSSFQPGEMMVLKYKTPGGYAENAWIGIIPSDIEHGSEQTNDRHDLTYQYLKKSTAGEMVFNAPEKPGKYDLRLHNTDDNGKEVAYISFVVTGAAAPAKAEVGTGKTFNKGDKVMVEWHGRWWPAEVLETKAGCWQIHYDGYSNSWDECVGTARIKNR